MTNKCVIEDDEKQEMSFELFQEKVLWEWARNSIGYDWYLSASTGVKEEIKWKETEINKSEEENSFNKGSSSINYTSKKEREI